MQITPCSSFNPTILENLTTFQLHGSFEFGGKSWPNAHDTWLAGLFCGALIKVLEECSSVFQSSVIYFDHVQFWVIYSKSKSRFLSWVIGFARDNCSDCISALSSGHKPQARGEAPDNAISCYTYGINDASWLWMNLGGRIWMRRCHVCAGSLFHACKP
jgi:hypothetical protein